MLKACNLSGGLRGVYLPFQRIELDSGGRQDQLASPSPFALLPPSCKYQVYGQTSFVLRYCPTPNKTIDIGTAKVKDVARKASFEVGRNLGNALSPASPEPLHRLQNRS